jgi:NAD+ synthase
MKLQENSLKIDPEKYSKKIVEFIRNKMKELKRDGIVVPISGGLDSSVVATLCVRAVGKDKVIGLLLPEKDTPKEADHYARLLANYLGIKTVRKEITPYLKVVGAFTGAFNLIPTTNLRNSVARLYLKKTRKDAAINSFSGNSPDYIKQNVANINLRQRVRLIEVYRFAEPRNLMFVGSAHKSEDLVGLYVKYGVDDCADVMPLKNLFRTEFLQIGEYIGVPKEILRRSPKPDIIPGVEDKYKDILGIDSKTVDLILYGMENKMSIKDISNQLKISEAEVKNIENIMKSTSHMREHSMAPEF